MTVSTGRVEGLFVGATPGEPLRAVASVVAAAGQGLQGDRNWQGPGGSARKHGPDREITLIEAEALEALRRENGVELAPVESRRNVLTRGVPLNRLVGREFQVGPVRLRGIRLCEPCDHLESLTRPGVLAGLVHRGGLRAQVLVGGEIKVGDSVEVEVETRD